jgi:hypothetical protein
VSDPGSDAHGTVDPYAGEVPYSKRQSVTASPPGFTVALRLAEVRATADA